MKTFWWTTSTTFQTTQRRCLSLITPGGWWVEHFHMFVFLFLNSSLINFVYVMLTLEQELSWIEREINSAFEAGRECRRSKVGDKIPFRFTFILFPQSKLVYDTCCYVLFERAPVVGRGAIRNQNIPRETNFKFIPGSPLFVAFLLRYVRVRRAQALIAAIPEKHG